MHRRVFILAIAPVTLSACSAAKTILRRGESVSYALFNPSHRNSFEMGRLEAPDEELLLDEGLSVPALSPGAPGWSGGGPMFFADTGHRVPDRVEVSWRLPPREGQARYKGDLVGPFTIELRSRIPAEALAALSTPGIRRRIEIGVSVGVLPILVRWLLVDTTKGGGLPTLMRGGDWT